MPEQGQRDHRLALTYSHCLDSAAPSGWQMKQSCRYQSLQQNNVQYAIMPIFVSSVNSRWHHVRPLAIHELQVDAQMSHVERKISQSSKVRDQLRINRNGPAQPRMSRPDNPMGIPWAWIGVGDWYSRSRTSRMILACKFCTFTPAILQSRHSVLTRF